MNKNIILFGASNLGKSAYAILRNSYNIIYFCDNSPDKWGGIIEGIEVIPPSRLKEIDNADIVITSTYNVEITQQLISMGISGFKVFRHILQDHIAKSTGTGETKQKEKNIKFLDLGDFLSSIQGDLSIGNMTFLAGGSGLLDYVFLKALMIKFGFGRYLEIGTWTGESITAVSEVADKCYSISMPDDDKEIIDYFRDILRKNNFSRYFSKAHPNIIHFCEDSKTFDFSCIREKIDLVFIDGDHSYEGVRRDTENIFKLIDPENSIVVWHDFKDIRNKFIEPTVKAVFDILPNRMHNNIYAVDANYCGVYIPDRYEEYFKLSNDPDKIYSYSIDIKTKANKL